MIWGILIGIGICVVAVVGYTIYMGKKHGG